VSAIVLSNVIAPTALAKIRAAVARGPFLSGKETAVGGAAGVKANLILSPDGAAATEAVELLAGALQAHAGFQAAAWPDAMLRPQFCRYEVGMKYGAHVDAAIMGDASAPIRCDVAMTVCLNDGADYDGGELVIDAAGAPTSWKGRAGDVIVYPADTLHRVAEVTRGTREVAVSWIQSMIRDPGRRRILYDLRTALDALERAPQPAAEVDTLRRTYFNLIRMWA
jgi:PKHD-type hydroxylase